MIKLSSLCHHHVAVEFHDTTAHLKEPLYTKFFRRPAQFENRTDRPLRMDT